MKQKVILELMDGNSEEGTLKHPFKPSDSSIEVILDSTERDRLSS